MLAKNSFEDLYSKRQWKRIFRALSTSFVVSAIIVYTISISQSWLDPPRASPTALDSSADQEFEAMSLSDDQIAGVEEKLASRARRLTKSLAMADGRSISVEAQLAQAQAHLESLRPENVIPDLDALRKRATLEYDASFLHLHEHMRSTYSAIASYDQTQDSLLTAAASRQRSFSSSTAAAAAAAAAAARATAAAAANLSSAVSTAEETFHASVVQRLRNYSEELTRRGEATARLILQPGGLWYYVHPLDCRLIAL